jgi:quercetin dioxygenase-like cupin family protein
MPEFVDAPVVVEAAGNKPKKIEEYAGRVRTQQDNVSVARMRSPRGWREPAQRPEFQEITLVLQGVLHVEFEGGEQAVSAGQAIITQPGEWVRYSTPDSEAEYVAVCLPAFSPETVHREE